METLLSDCVVDQELGREIEKRSKLFAIPSDCVLFHQGDQAAKLYFLKSGAVELSMTTQDKTLLTLYAHAGSIIGLPGVLTDRPYSLTARAMGGAEICEITPTDFHKMIGTNAKFAGQVLRILASEFQSIYHVLRYGE